MKTILQPNAGLLGTRLTARAERLRRTPLQVQLLRPSLWTPVRVPPRPGVAANARSALTPSIGGSPRAAARIRQAVGRIATPAARSVTKTMRPSGNATRPTAAPAVRIGRPTKSTRPSLALQQTAVRGNSVVGPVSPGGGTRMPSLRTVIGQLTQRSSRASGALPSSRGSARSRFASPLSQSTRRSRPASALAAQTSQRGEAGRAPMSSSSLSPMQARGSTQGTSRASAGAEGGSSNAAISLSGDLVVDGRKLGELAVNSANRSGSAAQTGARSPNFRRTALPSGLSAPLP